MTTRRWIILSIYLVVFASAAVALYLYVFDDARLDDLTVEDGFLEYLQAAFFLGASIVFLVGWLRGRCRNTFLLGWAVVLLVVAGEEISWGQRIFGVATPDSLAARNVQGETTIHNLDGIHQHIRALAMVCILGVTVAMPLTERWSTRCRSLYARFSIPVVPAWTIPITALGVAFMVVPRLGGEVVFSLDEMGEAYVAATFFLFALSWWWGVRHGDRRPADRDEPPPDLEEAPVDLSRST